jgi:hypothetical protein
MLKKSIITISLISLFIFSPMIYKKYYIKEIVDTPLEIDLYNLRTGKEESLANLLSGKTTLIYYTSTSCSVCVRQRQMFEELPPSQKQTLQWLDIVARPDQITEWMAKYGSLHDVVTLDIKREFESALKLNATPVILLVNKNKEIIFYNRGFLEHGKWNAKLYPLVLNAEFDI